MDALNLQDLKMADQKEQRLKKEELENNGPNRRALFFFGPPFSRSCIFKVLHFQSPQTDRAVITHFGQFTFYMTDINKPEESS